MTIAGAGTETELQFEHCVLATGSYPARVPSLSIDSPRVLDSTSALDLPDIPGSLLVVGGGYIGLELGTVYATLGSKVSVVEMTSGLLPGADRDLVNVLHKRLEKLFAAIMLNTKVLNVAEAPEGIRVVLEGDVTPKEQTFDRVLVAVGRRPNSKIPGLDLYVRVDENGFIEVDGQRRTAEPLIFAIGDALRADARARRHTRLVWHRRDCRQQGGVRAAIPAVVFTDPEIAWCGLTEAGPTRRELPLKSRSFLGRAEPRDHDRPARWAHETDTRTKKWPCARRRDCRQRRGGAIAEGVLAVEMGATAEDLEDHPSASDALGIADGERRGLLRPKHPRLQTKAQIGINLGIEDTWTGKDSDCDVCRTDGDLGLQIARAGGIAPPAYTEEQSKRGMNCKKQCASCHGDDLKETRSFRA